jgi:hypothetical protein
MTMIAPEQKERVPTIWDVLSELSEAVTMLRSARETRGRRARPRSARSTTSAPCGPTPTPASSPGWRRSFSFSGKAVPGERRR